MSFQPGGKPPTVTRRDPLSPSTNRSFASADLRYRPRAGHPCGRSDNLSAIITLLGIRATTSQTNHANNGDRGYECSH